MRQTHHQALRHNAMAIAIAIVAALVMQGVVSSGVVLRDSPHPLAPVPKAMGGYAYWPNGTVAKGVSMQVTIKNNNTGATLLVATNPANGAYSTNVNVDLNNVMYVSCIYNGMWAQNQTVYTGQTILLCNLRLVQFPFGPKLVSAAAGGSVTGYGGAVTLNVPAGALASDRILYGMGAFACKPGSLESITLLPSPLTFTAPATLSWSYAGIDIGQTPVESLAVYTSDGGAWERLPSVVDAQAKTVVAQVNHFSNFSLGGALAFGNQTGLVNVYPGTASAPILDLTAVNTAAAPDALDYVNVMFNSTNNADIAGVSLWNDIDNDGSVGAGDIQLGAAMPAGSANFTSIGLAIPAGASANLLVAVDVSAAAVAGHFLDLRIPALGIGLANAGLLEQAIDPAGNATVSHELTDPHAVYGFVSNIFGPLANVWVNLTNNRTLATENLITDGLGRYEVNLGLMDGGYADWDEIFVQANDTLGQDGWNVTHVDIGMFGERCDVFIGRGPLAGNETPADGSTIAEIYRNITVNITGGTGGMNLSTIILGVEGVNYTWGDASLSFAGGTLTFNTSAAVGSWMNGQGVNVTLWRADDTVGNPCQNAPYRWNFTVDLGPGPVAGNETPAMGSVITGAAVNITVNITGGTLGIDLSTIVLEVEGINYTWGNANLSFSGETLTFNTSGAVGAWTDGQVVNVTLWSAGDGAGNPCQNAPYTWWFSVSLGIVSAAPDIRVHKAGADINITWNAVPNATHYNVYASLAVDGTGFNFSAPMGVATGTYFVHAGALSAASNYSYVVRGASAAGEGPKSNIGWKLRKQLVENAATTDINWIALPYNSDLKFAQDLINDLGGAANVNYVSRWVATSQSLQNKPPVGGLNWAIVPGEGLLVSMKATMIYTMVGSYNATTMMTLVENAATTDINWIALPYHSTLKFAQDLINDLGGAATVNYVSRWVATSQSLQNKPPVGGLNWAIVPGEGLLVSAKVMIPNYDLGSVQNP